MKNVLLLIVLGSTTLLYAAPMSHTNTDQNVRQKRDNTHQRTRSPDNHRQIQRQTKQRDTQNVERKKTIRMKKQPQHTKQYQEQKRQPKKQINHRDTQSVERTKTIRMKKQPQHTKRSFRTHEQKRRIAKRVNQRDSVQRTFRTHVEFNRARPRLKANYYHIYDRRDYKRRHNIRQSGLTYFIHSWYLIYENRHAPFYDNYGYFYGFFNEFGYFFEGIFYAYDRYYTYEDRLRGMGLFDNRYYAPYLEDGYDDWYDMYDDPYYN